MTSKSPEIARQARRALLAPDSFKGTHSALEVAFALERGVSRNDYIADLCPVADGGEGTLSVLYAQLGGQITAVSVHDPLGAIISSEYLVLPDGTAVIETARASGLGIHPISVSTALSASTYGTGELVAHAVKSACQHILVTVGGSASTDGGRGAVEAITEAGGTRSAKLTVLCDVDTPYEDAARIFAPQKGATADIVDQLSLRLAEFAQSLPRDPSAVPKTGCAGGLSGALWSKYGAELVSGAEFVLHEVGFEQRITNTSFVITGEGALDRQTQAGKLVSVIAKLAIRSGVPCFAIVGRENISPTDSQAMGISRVREASTLDEIADAAERLCIDGAIG